MSILSKEQIKDLIQENNMTSVGDIHITLKNMFKDVLQEMLEAELDQELGYTKYDVKGKKTANARNGHSKKTVKTEFGNMSLDIPRDRQGEFEPQVVPKHRRDISGIEDKIIALYARGMSTRDIHAQINEIYGIEVSAEMVSKITDRILPEIEEWQNRPLDPVYPFVFMDAIHYKVRDSGRIVSKAAYVVLGVDIEGYKNVLGIWIGENESSKFWLTVLNGLKNRGVKDVILFSVDGLTGLKEAIAAAYPASEIQRCVIHQLRNSFKYVSYKHLKEFSKDFKAVYTAPTETYALEQLENVREKWGAQYPYAIQSWENNWDVLSPYFKYSNEIRRIIYTTNAIESLHRQYRKVTKAKSVLPTDSALKKILYLATRNITKKWTRRYPNWDQVINQLLILFPERLESYL